MEGRQRLLNGFLKYFGNVYLPDITRCAWILSAPTARQDQGLNHHREITALKGMFSKAVVWGKQRTTPPRSSSCLKRTTAGRASEKGDIATCCLPVRIGCGLL